MNEAPEFKNEMDKLLFWLNPDREKAIELYLNLQQRLIYYFRDFDDREDLAGEVFNRTLDNFRKDTVITEIDPAKYLYAIARNIKRENFRKRRFLSLDESPETGNLVQPSRENSTEEFDEKYQIVKDCIESLGAKGDLFLKYHSVPEGMDTDEYRNQVAESENITLYYLRVKIFRIKKKIIKCFEKKI